MLIMPPCRHFTRDVHIAATLRHAICCHYLRHAAMPYSLRMVFHMPLLLCLLRRHFRHYLLYISTPFTDISYSRHFFITPLLSLFIYRHATYAIYILPLMPPAAAMSDDELPSLSAFTRHAPPFITPLLPCHEHEAITPLAPAITVSCHCYFRLQPLVARC